MSATIDLPVDFNLDDEHDYDVFGDVPCPHLAVEFDYTIMRLVCQCCGEPVNSEVNHEK